MQLLLLILLPKLLLPLRILPLPFLYNNNIFTYSTTTPTSANTLSTCTTNDNVSAITAKEYTITNIISLTSTVLNLLPLQIH